MNTPTAPEKRTRYDIFKGVMNSEGKLQKTKSLGRAYLHSNGKGYTLYLRTFLKDAFYLLPETKDLSRGDFAILTRLPSPTDKKRFLWNNVGQGWALKGENGGLIHLQWDLLGANDIYLALRTESDPRYPILDQEPSA